MNKLDKKFLKVSSEESSPNFDELAGLLRTLSRGLKPDPDLEMKL